jgi:hypothetical protein
MFATYVFFKLDGLAVNFLYEAILGDYQNWFKI